MSFETIENVLNINVDAIMTCAMAAVLLLSLIASLIPVPARAAAVPAAWRPA